MAGWIKKKQNSSMRSLKETQFRSKDTQTERERMDKDVPCKWKQKENWCIYHIKQKRL